MEYNVIDNTGLVYISNRLIQMNFYVSFRSADTIRDLIVIYPTIHLFEYNQSIEYRLHDGNTLINKGCIDNIIVMNNVMKYYLKKEYKIDWSGKFYIRDIHIDKFLNEEQSRNMQELFCRFIVNQNNIVFAKPGIKPHE